MGGLEAKSNIWREAGVPIPDVSTLVGATGGTLGLKSVSALAFDLKSCAPDATTNEGDNACSVAEENKPVGSAQREATGDCAVSGEALFSSFCPAPFGSTDEASVDVYVSLDQGLWAAITKRQPCCRIRSKQCGSRPV